MSTEEINAELMRVMEVLAESWSVDFADELEYCRMVRKTAGDAYRKAAKANQQEIETK